MTQPTSSACRKLNFDATPAPLLTEKRKCPVNSELYNSPLSTSGPRPLSKRARILNKDFEITRDELKKLYALESSCQIGHLSPDEMIKIVDEVELVEHQIFKYLKCRKERASEIRKYVNTLILNPQASYHDIIAELSALAFFIARDKIFINLHQPPFQLARVQEIHNEIDQLTTHQAYRFPLSTGVHNYLLTAFARHIILDSGLHSFGAHHLITHLLSDQKIARHIPNIEEISQALNALFINPCTLQNLENFGSTLDTSTIQPEFARWTRAFLRLEIEQQLAPTHIIWAMLIPLLDCHRQRSEENCYAVATFGFLQQEDPEALFKLWACLLQDNSVYCQDTLIAFPHHRLNEIMAKSKNLTNYVSPFFASRSTIVYQAARVSGILSLTPLTELNDTFSPLKIALDSLKGNVYQREMLKKTVSCFSHNPFLNAALVAFEIIDANHNNKSDKNRFKNTLYAQGKRIKNSP